jgi:prophage regulatory protein
MTDANTDVKTKTPPPEHCILRIQEVERRTGYKRCYIYRLIRAGQFPDRSRIGIRSVGWDSVAVDQWVKERLNQNGR